MSQPSDPLSALILKVTVFAVITFVTDIFGIPALNDAVFVYALYFCASVAALSFFTRART